MDDVTARALDRLYPGRAVVRGGHRLPVTVRAFGPGPGAHLDVDGPDGTAHGVEVVLSADPVDVDPVLRADGQAFLDQVLRTTPAAHDGRVLCLDRVDPPAGDPWSGDADASGGSGAGPRPVVRVARGGYFDMLATCDAVSAELLAAGDATWSDLPMRRLVHEAAGDPLVSGRGRAAAFGVSVLLVVDGTLDGALDGGAGVGAGVPSVVVGRRSARVAAGTGLWHVAPSGMLEEAADGRHVATTVATELREELGVVRSVDEVQAGLRVLGLATDLLRLRPDLVVTLDLGPGADAGVGAGPAAGAGRPRAADLVQGEEFDELELVPLTRTGLGAFWARHGDGRVTAAGAGALTLLEASLPA